MDVLAVLISTASVTPVQTDNRFILTEISDGDNLYVEVDIEIYIYIDIYVTNINLLYVFDTEKLRQGEYIHSFWVIDLKYKL